MNSQTSSSSNHLNLSIIIPTYNVEKYIQTCLNSIYNQDINENRFEVIIINDGSTDNSLEVINDIKKEHTNIKIINQINQGVSIARNNGITLAKGEYILFVDSDDKLIEFSLGPFLDEALLNKVDIALADYIVVNDKDFLSINNPSLSEGIKIIEKSAEEIYLKDIAPWTCYVFRTLFRREFLIQNNIRFVPSITYEDQPFTHECYLKANKCFKAQWPVYIYRASRPYAITSNFDTKKAKDMCMSIAHSWKLTNLQGPSPKMHQKLKDNIFTHFKVLTFLLANNIKDVNERRQIIKYFKNLIPEMYFHHGVIQRLASFMFQSCPLFFIRIRYWYGIIWENTMLPYYYHRIKDSLTFTAKMFQRRG